MCLLLWVFRHTRPLPLCHAHHSVTSQQHFGHTMLHCTTQSLTLVCLKSRDIRHAEDTVVRRIVNTLHRSMSPINHDVSEKSPYQTHCPLQHRPLYVANLPRHAHPLCLAYNAHVSVVCVFRLPWGVPPLPLPRGDLPLPHHLEIARKRVCTSHAFGTYQNTHASQCVPI